MKMKALSVKQPWANMIASGKKTIETRYQPTNHRGELLIVSSKHPPKPEPAGFALCVVQVVDCRLMGPADERAACCPFYPEADLYAWILRDIRRIKPFAVKGQLGLYEVDHEIEYENDDQLLLDLHKTLSQDPSERWEREYQNKPLPLDQEPH